MNKLNFSKLNGLVPAVIQDYASLQVLMVGFMNEEAFDKTRKEGKVTFFSRTKNRLWTKGETSGNFLFVKEITTDCDNDAILIKAEPAGPVCHTGKKSCFGEEETKGFFYKLEQIIDQRIKDDVPDSYTNKIFKKGINNGWLDARAYGPAAVLGWNAVSTKVNEKGEVEGTCVGTGMAFDPAFYYKRPVNVAAAHGYGPVIMAGAEMIKLMKGWQIVINDSAVMFYKQGTDWRSNR